MRVIRYHVYLSGVDALLAHIIIQKSSANACTIQQEYGLFIIEQLAYQNIQYTSILAQKEMLSNLTV
jgi:hypothetical protein